MRRRMKKSLSMFFLVMLCVSAFLAGCKEPEKTKELSSVPVETIVPDANGDGEIETRPLSLYIVDIDTYDVEDATAYIPADQEVTHEIIVNEVVGALLDYGVEITIESVSMQDETVRSISVPNTSAAKCKGYVPMSSNAPPPKSARMSRSLSATG